MKLTRNIIIICIAITGIIIGIFSCSHEPEAQPNNGSDSPREVQSKEERTDQFLKDLQEMAENPEETDGYWEIINKLPILVIKESEENPELMKPFLKNMVGLAVESGPLLALEVEIYADEALKKEMKQLREESSVIQAQEKEKEKQILSLEQEISRIKAENVRTQEGLQSELEKLQEENDKTLTRIAQLQETGKKFLSLEKIISQIKAENVRIQEDFQGEFGKFREKNNRASVQITQLQEKERKVSSLEREISRVKAENARTQEGFQSEVRELQEKNSKASTQVAQPLHEYKENWKIIIMCVVATIIVIIVLIFLKS